MSTTVYLLIAGNIIDGYNADVPNTVEVFSTRKAAEQYGEIFDFFNIEEKTLDPSIKLPSIG